MNLYLILHKVRGEPAFDIATLLSPIPNLSEEIWIIPTTGHRVHPFWHTPLDHVDFLNGSSPQSLVDEIVCPESWPDFWHYHRQPPRPEPRSEAPAPRRSVATLSDLLGAL